MRGYTELGIAFLLIILLGLITHYKPDPQQGEGLMQEKLFSEDEERYCRRWTRTFARTIERLLSMKPSEASNFCRIRGL